MKYLMRSSKAMMRYQMTGSYSRASKPESTPLRDLIESIPRSDWKLYKNVKLSHKLGFRASIRFDSLYQLYRWLGGDTEVVGNRRLPYQDYIIRGVNNITHDELEKHCSNFKKPYRDKK